MGLLRDSAGIVINQSGFPLFLPGSFSDTLLMQTFMANNAVDTLYTFHVQMKPSPTQVTVPAGTFDVINSNGVFTAYALSHPEF